MDVVATAVDTLNNLKASAFPTLFVAEHGVLKKLQNVLLKYVILLHCRLAVHFLWHSCTVGTFPGELFMYFSPALSSHLPLVSTSSHLPMSVKEPGQSKMEMRNGEEWRLELD